MIVSDVSDVADVVCVCVNRPIKTFPLFDCTSSFEYYKSGTRITTNQNFPLSEKQNSSIVLVVLNTTKAEQDQVSSTTTVQSKY